MSRLCALVLGLVGAASCGTGGGGSPPAPVTPAASEPSGAEVVTPAVQAQLDRALDLGRSIYVQDVMSAWGTDVLRENVQSLEGLRGYVTLAEGDDAGKPTGSWLVQFFTGESPPRVRYKIRLWKDRRQPPAFEALDPPKPMSPSEQVIVAARAAAIQAIPPPRQPINPVVLPAAAIGEKGTLVYLLAGTTRKGVVVLGLHHRVLVGEDGQVKKVEPLSKSIIEIAPTAGEDEQVAALVVTHLVTDLPIETHVFAALLHRQPVYVGTRTGKWRVTGKEIAFLGP